MRIWLVPDPESPNGDDAFCREIARGAVARGHVAVISPTISGALPGDLVLVNRFQSEPLRLARAAGCKTAIRFIDSYPGADAEALNEVRGLTLAADRVLVPNLHLATLVKSWGANGQVRQVPYAYDKIPAQAIAMVTVRASRSSFPVVCCSSFDRAALPGLETLVLAVSRLRLGCHLFLIGEGPGELALKERVRQLAITDKVSFLGKLPHQKTLEYIRASKAYIDPCGLEGFPTMGLYALAEGCPVIAAKAGALTELIQDRVNGMMFNHGSPASLCEAIVTLWSVRGLSLRLIEEGIRTISNHSWEHTVQAVFEALEDL